MKLLAWKEIARLCYWDAYMIYLYKHRNYSNLNLSYLILHTVVGDAPNIAKYCSPMATSAIMSSREMPSSTTVASAIQSTSMVKPTQAYVEDSSKYLVLTSLTYAYQTSSLASSLFDTSHNAMLHTPQLGRTTVTIQLET